MLGIGRKNRFLTGSGLWAKIAVSALGGAVGGLAYQDVAQHVARLGWLDTVFGAKLGMLGYDWGALGEGALVGALSSVAAFALLGSFRRGARLAGLRARR